MVAVGFQFDSFETILSKHWNWAAGIICFATSCGAAAEAVDAVPMTAPAAPRSTAVPAARDLLRVETRVISERDKGLPNVRGLRVARGGPSRARVPGSRPCCAVRREQL
ncbi:hypothetical protein SSP531S_56790 [Streptomyces spongiicola]|uniref:Uncharacterized protein n=1 Tax=Streptomyces spongiicola TaxID=1690221 RepID=A0A388T5H2_9ACTN|nr:hypothetical protein SSP531S_56790 [Streptomyces spongiicola]